MSAPRPVRVLCVDDLPDAADSTAALLDLFGYDARACCDARSAVQLAEQFRPDACLFDLDMPGMDGDELAAAVRAASPGRQVLFVAVTATGSDAARDRTRRAGFRRHLLKPAAAEELLAALAELDRRPTLRPDAAPEAVSLTDGGTAGPAGGDPPWTGSGWSGCCGSRTTCSARRPAGGTTTSGRP